MMRAPQPFSERRYTEEELGRILDAAVRLDSDEDLGSSSSEGYTLEEIREIANEVGIDPAFVERAAAELVAADASRTPATRGSTFSRFVDENLRAVVHEEVLIQRPMSDDEMLALVHHFESMTPWPGSLRHSGQWVEWRAQNDRLYLGVMRGRAQTRIRLIADQSGELSAGAGAIGLASMILLGAAGSFLALPPLGLLALGSGGLYWTWRSRVNQARLRRLAAILERMA